MTQFGHLSKLLCVVTLCIVSPNFRTMFPPCLTRMYEHHCTFLQRLEERTINWKWQGLIGDVLQRAFDPHQVSSLLIVTQLKNILIAEYSKACLEWSLNFLQRKVTI